MSVNSGNGELVGCGEETSNGNGVNHLEFLKDILHLLDWINGENSGTIRRENSSPSPLTIKLEERFTSVKARIHELEGQLSEAQEENGVLKEKLNCMELFAGHQQSELIRLNNELEELKWEKFDVESRLKSMIKEVAELQATLGELVVKLREDEESAVQLPGITGGDVMIKREIPDTLGEETEEEERLEVEKDKNKDVQAMFVEMTGHVQERLQKCEEMQTETRIELAGIITGLANMEQIIVKRKVVKKRPTSSSKSSTLQVNKSRTTPCVVNRPVVNLPKPVNYSKIIPVPIKSILMKRSADGTFVIRRRSEEQQVQQQGLINQQRLVGAARRKHVQFCLQDPNAGTIHTDLNENHKQQRPSAFQTQQLQQLPPDPLEIDHLHELPNEEEHFQVTTPTVPGDRFYCSCGTSFRYKKLLNRHLSAKLNGKIFNCHLCSKTFVLHESLKKHVQRSHQSQYQGGRFGCRECGQTFPLYRQLRQHRMIHQRHKLFFS